MNAPTCPTNHARRATQAARLLVAALVIAAGCSTTTTTSTPITLDSAPPTGRPAPAPASTSATSRPTTVGNHWETVGSLTIARRYPHVIALGDGSALVVGNESCGRDAESLTPDDLSLTCDPCVRRDSRFTEILGPSSGAWARIDSLPKPRAEFVAVALADGRTLVTGGVNPGVSWYDQGGHQSYSSTYIFDPQQPDQGWSKAGLLGTARTAPTAAALLDGRVLVAGGYYMSGSEANATWPPEGRGPESGGTLLAGGSSIAVLAAERSAAATGIQTAAQLADSDPGPPPVAALATAELYDPATGTWTATGSMLYARYGAKAATLADGRVLIVGSSITRASWNDTWIRVDDAASWTVEIYDPATGRFSLTDDLPSLDWSAVEDLVITREGTSLLDNGTLVALADGGALLVGRTEAWSGSADNHGYEATTIRFDPDAGRWTVVDRSLYLDNHATNQITAIVQGHSRLETTAARFPDGRVIVAGGASFVHYDPVNETPFLLHPELHDPASVYIVGTAEAALYDPVSGSWMALPPMPEARAGGAAVTLQDGSVVIVGGYYAPEYSETWYYRQCGSATPGLTSAVRFVPAP